MRLRTQCYLPEPAHEPVDPLLGLRDLRKGLNCILMGYLCWAAAILGAVGIVWYFSVLVGGTAQSRKAADDASVVIFALALLMPLTGIGSLILIVRGKWLCLASAPEQCYAKWMMFLSILCILAGPTLNWGTLVIGDDKPAKRGRAANSWSVTHIEDEIEEFKQGVAELGTHAYIKLAGKGIGLLSGVFFVLFLRAVALSWNASLRARFTELYLLFLALLVAGVVVLIHNPSYMLARPRLLLALGAGWLIAGPWYFVLILSASVRISTMLAQRSRQPELPPAAPPSSSLPPLPEMMN